GKRDSPAQVRGLPRIAERVGEARIRSIRELRQPELDAAAAEPAREFGLEAGEPAQTDVRPGLRRTGRLGAGARVGVVRPAIKRKMRIAGGDETGEVPRRLAVA